MENSPKERIGEITSSGEKFYELLETEINGRYLSWEHCYGAFSIYKGKKVLESELDYLSLHLSFYLASWGMYRGSSFLLQKDYKVHNQAVTELLEEKYVSLWAISPSEYNYNTLHLLFSLVNELKLIYSQIRISANQSIHREEPKNQISDVLITKILMGTLGCVPAYDRFFCEGIKKHAVASTLFNINSVRNLSVFYEEHRSEFEKIRKVMSKTIIYPEMKVLDMCFWQIGYEDSLKNN